MCTKSSSSISSMYHLHYVLLFSCNCWFAALSCCHRWWCRMKDLVTADSRVMERNLSCFSLIQKVCNHQHALVVTTTLLYPAQLPCMSAFNLIAGCCLILGSLDSKIRYHYVDRVIPCFSLCTGKKGYIGVWNLSDWSKVGYKKFSDVPISAFAVTRDGKFLGM